MALTLRLGPEDFATQKQNRAERPVLRAGRNTLSHGQVREVVADRLESTRGCG
jgi:hypothetical protein